jgi:hypothetical protein
MSKTKKSQKRKSNVGRKPKPEGQRVAHRIGAGVTEAEWPIVQSKIKESGLSQSTIIRGAFGLPPATV